MIAFEDVIEEAFERKRLKYAYLVVEAREQDWQAYTRPVEIGVKGFVAKSTAWLLLDFGVQGQSLEFSKTSFFKSEPVVMAEALTD